MTTPPDCPRCQALHDELMRLKNEASIDLQNMTSNMVAKDRVIGKLKKELAAHREEDPESAKVKELLTYARDRLGKQKNWYIGMDGDRAALAKKVLTRYGLERCKHAADGLARKPFAGPRGRSPEPYPGAKRWDDVDYCWGTDKRFTDCEQVHQDAQQPQAETPSPSVPVLTLVEALPYSPLEVVYDRANRLGLDPQGEVWLFRARCPAHEDKDRSLLVRDDVDRRATLFCAVRCSPEEIAKALGLPWGALFPEGHRHHSLTGLRKAA